jgi:hypothetical protein
MENFGFEDELNEMGATARLNDSESRVKELEKANAILKMENSSEVNNKLIEIEMELEKVKQQSEKLEHDKKLLEKRVKSRDEDLEQARVEV